MNTGKRRAFIINFVYFALILVTTFIILKYGMSVLSPFIAAFIIAYLLRIPIRFFTYKLRVPKKISAILVVLIFYGTIGVLFSLVWLRLLALAESLIRNMPLIYAIHVEPLFTSVMNMIEEAATRMDPSLTQMLENASNQLIQSLGQMVSSLSVKAMSFLSGLASSLPGTFIKLLLAIISTFFIAADYDKLTGFCLRQLSEKGKHIFIEIKEYIIGTLFVCIRSYALIMTITFIELAIGLSILGIQQSVLIALCIAVFDILPVLGTGGIMIPWAVITVIQGNYPLALGLLILYVVITVIRNIIEPKIVGVQIGLHPVVTLASMYAGVQFFGVIGLFGFPIGLSLLQYLNGKGIIHLFKTE